MTPPQIDAENPLPILQRSLPDFAEAATHASVVAQDVHASKVGERPLRQLFD